MGRHSDLGDTQRVEVVLMMLRKEEPITTLARRYNVSENTLHRWREEFLDGGRAALADRRGKKKGEQTAEIARLKKELARRDQVIGDFSHGRNAPVFSLGASARVAVVDENDFAISGKHRELGRPVSAVGRQACYENQRLSLTVHLAI